MSVVRTMAYDHQPYSSNAIGVPDRLADAQRQGTALWLDDADFRQIEWMDASMDVKMRAAVGDFHAS